MDQLDEFLANAGEIETKFFGDFGFKQSSIKSSNGELVVRSHYNAILGERHDSVIFEINDELLDLPDELEPVLLQLKLANDLTEMEAIKLKVGQMGNLFKFTKMIQDELGDEEE